VSKEYKYFRTFLNKDKGLAAVEVAVEDNYASLDISDCSRKVSIDFSTTTTRGKKVSNADKVRIRAKLNKLRYALDFLEEGLLGDGD
jgi:hypothetical protein